MAYPETLPTVGASEDTWGTTLNTAVGNIDSRLNDAETDADVLGSGAATDGQVLTADGAGGAAWEDVPAAGGGLTDVVDDTTPQLGGTLDVNGNAIQDVTDGTVQVDDNLDVVGNITVSGTVDGRDVATDGTKLDGIEASADVTDATNVDAAGATMNTDTDVSGTSWVLDEDTMSSDSAAKVPTQQSVKAYVDTADQAIEGGETRVNTVAASGATETLPAEYAAHKVTMDQNCTFTFPAPTEDGAAFGLYLAGAYTPTFPASVVWDGGSAPTYASPSLYVFATFDGGTTWVGSLVGSALA